MDDAEYLDTVQGLVGIANANALNDAAELKPARATRRSSRNFVKLTGAARVAATSRPVYSGRRFVVYPEPWRPYPNHGARRAGAADRGDLPCRPAFTRAGPSIGSRRGTRLTTCRSRTCRLLCLRRYEATRSLAPTALGVVSEHGEPMPRPARRRNGGSGPTFRRMWRLARCGTGYSRRWRRVPVRDLL